MTDLVVRDAPRHLHHPWRKGPFCCSGSARNVNFATVNDWALVTCRRCQKKRIQDALRDSGHSGLQIFKAAAEQLGVDY